MINDHGGVDHGLGGVDAAFVGAHAAAVLGDPGEGALERPAPVQHVEADLVIGAAHHGDGQVPDAGGEDGVRVLTRV